MKSKKPSTESDFKWDEILGGRMHKESIMSTPAVSVTVFNPPEKRKKKYGGSMIKNKKRLGYAEGSLMVASEMEDMPEDTYPTVPPEEQAAVEAAQLSDGETEANYQDFVIDESLDEEEQDYLMSALEADPLLSNIFDKIVDTAAEFSGEGEVEGPGTGVTDSIPARLSNGEFVMTQKATDQIGADNLQTLMDEAERAYDGGLQRMEYAFGGIVGSDEEELLEEEDEEIKKQMLSANQMPSVQG
jgi:hypothetical protein